VKGMNDQNGELVYNNVPKNKTTKFNCQGSYVPEPRKDVRIRDNNCRRSSWDDSESLGGDGE